MCACVCVCPFSFSNLFLILTSLFSILLSLSFSNFLSLSSLHIPTTSTLCWRQIKFSLLSSEQFCLLYVISRHLERCEIISSVRFWMEGMAITLSSAKEWADGGELVLREVEGESVCVCEAEKEKCACAQKNEAKVNSIKFVQKQVCVKAFLPLPLFLSFVMESLRSWRRDIAHDSGVFPRPSHTSKRKQSHFLRQIGATSSLNSCSLLYLI